MLKKEANKCKSINDYAELGFNVFGDFPFKYFGWTIRSAQVKGDTLKITIQWSLTG
jgi:hypothetical protein